MTYIPHNDGARLPADASLEILREGNVVVQELQQVIRLFFLEADDIPRDWDFSARSFLS